MTLKEIMRLEHVSFFNQERSILSNISGTFYKEQITTFVGPSGSGKSTLFRLLNGLISPNSGKIFIRNKSIEKIDPIDLRRKVGIVLQDAIMLPGTVFDNLALPHQLHELPFTKDDAKQLLNLVGLETEYLLKPAKELSGGQKQKVSIARTLANEPEILLLDEITSSLDQISVQKIEKLIETIMHKYHLTILWITHDVDQAVRLGDKTWVLMNGQVVEQIESSRLNEASDKRVQAFLKGESSQ